MNIEEIKERAKKNELLPSCDLIDLSSDVKYLLSILGHQERFLKQLRSDTEFMWKVPNIAVMQEMIDGALQAIRGSE